MMVGMKSSGWLLPCSLPSFAAEKMTVQQLTDLSRKSDGPAFASGLRDTLGDKALKGAQRIHR